MGSAGRLRETVIVSENVNSCRRLFGREERLEDRFRIVLAYTPPVPISVSEPVPSNPGPRGGVVYRAIRSAREAGSRCGQTRGRNLPCDALSLSRTHVSVVRQHTASNPEASPHLQSCHAPCERQTET